MSLSTIFQPASTHSEDTSTGSPQSDDEIRLLADAINRSTFCVPIRFLIDAHLPLRGIAQSSFDIFFPFLGLVLNKTIRDGIKMALSNTTSCQKLVDYLYDQEVRPQPMI